MQRIEGVNEFEEAFRLGWPEHSNHGDSESMDGSDNETVGDLHSLTGDYDFSSDVDCDEGPSGTDGNALYAPSALIISDTLHVSPPQHEDILNVTVKPVLRYRHSPYRKILAPSNEAALGITVHEVAANCAVTDATAPHFLEWVEDEHLAAEPMVDASSAPKTMCCYFKLKGKCKMGSRCWYGHAGNLYTPCHYGSGCKAGHATLALMAQGAAATHDSYVLSAALLAQADAALTVRVGW